jgi:hypothetical protein
MQGSEITCSHDGACERLITLRQALGIKARLGVYILSDVVRITDKDLVEYILAMR